MIEFNAQLFVSEQLSRQLVNTTQDVAMRCVRYLAEKFHFDAEKEMENLGLNMIKIERKSIVKSKEMKSKKMEKKEKTAFPLPYNGEFASECCYALRQNNGLYTQCTGLRKGEEKYCKGCAKQMQKVGAESPEYGTIQDRMAVGIFEYVDPKGRKPIAYTKIMKKYKVNKEAVELEASKYNMVVNSKHFEVLEESKRGRPSKEKAPKEKGAKGRPKKAKKVLLIEGEDEDLFAQLVAETTESESIDISQKKKSTKSEEEKEAERLAAEKAKAEKEAKRAAEKAEKEAKLAAEKAEKEAKKKAEEEARAAKKAAEEAEKQAKKEAAEKAKAEKEAKRAAEKAEKEAAKLAKKSNSSKNDEPEEQEILKSIKYEGKKYLKSKKSGIIYDYNEYVNNGELEVLGKWSDEMNKIVFNEDDSDDDEESEEQYEM